MLGREWSLAVEEMDRADTYRSVWRSLMDLEFRQAYVEAAGVRTRYVMAGSPRKPPLVFLHSTGSHWEVYCANIGPLAEHFQCFAFDMIGCGLTDRPDCAYEIKDYVDHVRGFMDAMKIPSASFIADSLGCWVACRLAHDDPDRVRRMVLACPPGLIGEISPSTQAVLNSARSAPPEPTWQRTRQGLERLVYDPTTMFDDIVAIRQDLRRRGTSNMPLTLFDPEIRRRNLLSEREWQGITTPTLVLEHIDTDDEYLVTARRIAELMPNAVLVEMREVGHWPPFERPAAFNALAIDFLTAPAT
jgi:2-hydroxy-6-oxonona-2,4-dienedioate hydrolase